MANTKDAIRCINALSKSAALYGVPSNTHTILHPAKLVWSFGIEHAVCSCGVLRINDVVIPCYKTGLRKQSISEAYAQLGVAVDNLFVALSKSLRVK